MKRLFPILAVALLAPTSAAVAQDGQRRPLPRESSGYEAGSRSLPANTPYRGPAGQVCVAWCPGDLNPCDPPIFKQADGRCMRND